jgi:Lrp/AsnC family transcriptional regulator, leucine-responsive regulatory protein
MNELDDIDKQILQALQQNARTTIKELSFDLKLSQTPIYERIKRLERDGFIQGYVALLSKEKLDKPMLAYCNVQLKEHAKPFLVEFEQEVVKFHEVVECYYIAGNFDYLLRVLVKDIAEYQNFMVNKLAALENIQNVQSMFVMTEVKWSTRLPIKIE